MTDRAGRLVALGAFAVVRAAVWLTGGRFSMDLLGLQPQLLDPAQLRAHPFGAVADLHSQPPLYNLLVGVVLRWSPLPDALSFQILWVGCGVGIALGCRAIARHLGASPAVATAAAVAVALDPTLITYEHTLTYEYPVAALLVGLVWAVARDERTPSVATGAAVVAAATAIVLTRSLFHPAWLLLVVVPLLARRRPERARLAGIAAVAVLLVAVPVVANGARFGSLGLSSLLGMNLQRSVTAPLPAGVVAADVEAGRLSGVALVTPFSELAAYADSGELEPGCGRTGTPVLDDPVRSTGFANFNAECYLDLYAVAQADALRALADHPGRFVGSRATAAWLYLGTDRFPGGDSTATDALARVTDPLLVTVEHHVDMSGWATPVAGLPGLDVHASLVLGAAVLLAVGRGAGALRRVAGRRAEEGDLTRLQLGATVAFVTVIGLTLELGENGRFRLLLDPLLLSLLVVEVGRLVERRRTPVSSSS